MIVVLLVLISESITWAVYLVPETHRTLGDKMAGGLIGGLPFIDFVVRVGEEIAGGLYGNIPLMDLVP